MVLEMDLPELRQDRRGRTMSDIRDDDHDDRHLHDTGDETAGPEPPDSDATSLHHSPRPGRKIARVLPTVIHVTELTEIGAGNGASTKASRGRPTTFAPRLLAAPHPQRPSDQEAFTLGSVLDRGISRPQ